MHVGGSEVFLEAMQLGRAGDRHDPGLLRQQPRKRDLRAGDALAPGQRAKLVDEGLVGLARFRREARNLVAEVAAVEARRLVDGAGEEAAAERTERHEADAEFVQSR